MTNKEVMQLMTAMGLHEGGMDDWVFDNAWVMFANAVASAEREACAKVCEEMRTYIGRNNAVTQSSAKDCAAAIRARGQKPVAYESSIGYMFGDKR